MSTINLNGIKMSRSAAEFAEETGVNPADDVIRLLGYWTCYDNADNADGVWLLDECLDGADENRAEGAREYYEAVVDAAERVYIAEANARDAVRLTSRLTSRRSVMRSFGFLASED
jgi:hypothetical protein